MELSARLVAGALVAVLACPPSFAQSAPEPTAPRAERPAAAISVDAQERELFEKSLTVTEKALEAWGVHDDPQALERVTDIGYRVARHSGYDDLPLSFYLIDMPAPNALALPGGQIFVTRGMLELGLTDDMLAALLGHEIGHVALDHHQRMQKKATWMNILTQAALVGVMVGVANSDRYRDDPDDRIRRRVLRDPLDPTYDEPTAGQVVQGAAAASLVLGEIFLRSYSREHEDEADEEGQRWAAAAGFSPTGTRDLMAHMDERMPQTREYGYLQTHPFMADRARAAESRARLLTRQEGKDDVAFRQGTQTALVKFRDTTAGLESPVVDTLEVAALAAWPQGEIADQIRLSRLHDLREETLAETAMGRDYGTLVATYRRELDTVRDLDPESPLVDTLTAELAALDTEREGLYERARGVLAEGVVETAFLERFASNWPTAPEIPQVALSLGDAYSRLGQATEAVERYLQAWRAGPETPQGQRAREGLRNLAPALDELAALQKLADQDDDPELARLAADRLGQAIKTFSHLANGADYLQRFPDGPHAGTVEERMNSLAEKLYNEVVLYRAVGDHVQALERIQAILEHAPASPAAEKLRDQAVLES
jgi:predicted Zn-dependent protease